MSWFSVPLPNPFKALQFSDDENEDETQPDPESQQPPNDTVSPSTGLKDDLSAFGETLGRQFRGVASFLSPPPPPPAAAAESSAADGGGLKLAGIRSDLAEIGGSFKTSLSLLSTTKAVSEISNLASNFFRLSDENEVGNDDDDQQRNNNDDDDDDGDDDEDEGPGITDEVIEFASKISNRSELWIDFPLSLDQEFDMSDAQSEHAAIIEQLVPSLANLRSTLSSDISEKQFWMIYFILLLPRLNEDDLELLSTPEIVEARETLLLMLRSKNDTEITSENPESDGSSNMDNKVKDREMEKNRSMEEKATISENLMASQSTEQVVADNSNARMVKEEHENTDNWLEQEEEPITSGPSYNAPKRFQSEEDVSFSDLEDDDDDRPSQSRRASSPEESNEWVRLNQSRGQSSSRERESEGEESSDWLKVDDFDP